jgi:hypothetical protein
MQKEGQDNMNLRSWLANKLRDQEQNVQPIPLPPHTAPPLYSISQRVSITLAQHGITEEEQLCQFKPSELIGKANIGKVALEEIEEHLKARGKSLKSESHSDFLKAVLTMLPKFSEDIAAATQHRKSTPENLDTIITQIVYRYGTPQWDIHNTPLNVSAKRIDAAKLTAEAYDQQRRQRIGRRY